MTPAQLQAALAALATQLTKVKTEYDASIRIPVQVLDVSGTDIPVTTTQYQPVRILRRNIVIDIIPPSPPTWPVLVFSNVTSSGQEIDWNDNTEPDLASYQVWRNTSGGAYSLINTTSASHYIDSGLSSLTNYGYKIKAVDRSGNVGNFSTAQSNTTLSSGATTNTANLWFFTNWESKAIGANLSLTSPRLFDSAPGTVQNDPLGIEGKVAQQNLTAGATNFPFGGVLESTPALTEGDEIWVSWKTYFPAGFNYNASPHLKWLRIHTATSPTGNGGYSDIYLNPSSGQSQYVWKFIYESDPASWHYFAKQSWHAPVTGRWIRSEVHVVLGAVASGSGGNAKVHFWWDEQLVGTVTDRVTMSAGKYVDRVHWNTYWNGGIPQTETAYFSDPAVAVKTASRDDTTSMVLNAETLTPWIGPT